MKDTELTSFPLWLGLAILLVHFWVMRKDINRMANAAERAAECQCGAR